MCLKAGAWTLPKKGKDPPAQLLEATEEGLVDGRRLRADNEI